MRVLGYVLTIMFIGFVTSCSPKVTEEIAVEKEPIIEVVKDDEGTPCKTFNKISPRDKDIAETSYVLYRDLVKLKKYEEALPYWKTGFSLAPAANGQIRYHFDDGMEIYKHLYSNAIGESKRAYVDTIMGIYDKRAQCYSDEADYIAGRKAFDRYYYYNEFSDENVIYDLFKQSIDSDQEKIDYFIINPFTKILSDRINSGEIGIEEGQNYAYRLIDAIDYGLKNCKGTDCDSWDIINNYAPIRLEAFEGIDGFYNCKYYADKYYPAYTSSPDDCDAIQLAYIRMVRGDCSQDDPRLLEVKDAYNKKCRVQNPTAGLLKQAYDLYTQGKYKDAVVKFEEFVDQTDDKELKSKYLYVISKIYYRDIKNFPQARKYALGAANFKSGWGEPYMLIGKLYASSGPLCGPGTGFDSQVVTWVAIDKFKYAKSVDPSVSKEANQLISQYQQYMPSKGDIFQRSINEGSTYTVGCWIQEKTTVRVAN